MAYGGLCKACPGGIDQCKDPVSAGSPIEMECPNCPGSGCEICSQGRITIDQCPLTVVDPATRKLIECAMLYKKGLPPIAGGSLDQAAYFTNAARIIFDEENYWKRITRNTDGQ